MRFLFPLFAITVAVLLIRAGRSTPPYDHGVPDFLKTVRPRALPLFVLHPHDGMGDPATTGAQHMFRGGPDRLGTTEVVWPSAGELKLKAEMPELNLGLHSASKASPVVDDSGGYVGGDSSWFYALDLHGKLKWKFRVKNSEWGIHATAAMDDSQVYLGAYNGRLYALAKKTGEVNWVRLLGDALGASPLVDGEYLYVAVETTRQVNGYVAKIKKRTGELVWTSPFLGEHAHSSPALSKEHHMVVVGANNSHLFGLDEESGDVKWKLAFPGPIKSTPSILGHIAIVTSWQSGVKAVDIRDGTLLWSKALQGGSQISPSLIPELGLVVIGDEVGEWQAFRVADGAAVWKRQWIPKTTEWMKGSATAQKFKTLSGEEWRLWVPCGARTLCLVKASSGELLRQWALPATLTGAPAVHENELWLALDGPLQIYTWSTH